jgi:hypothetical protein
MMAVVFGNANVSQVRYAAGTTVPATPIDGTHADIAGGAWGLFSNIPVASGQKVAVALFTYTNDGMPHFKRTGFILTGGQNSDKLALSAPASIALGAQPQISATLVRHSANGQTVPLSNNAVYLYVRPHGTSQAYAVVTGAFVDSQGLVTFPVTTGWSRSMDVEVRYSGINGAELRADAVVAIRTSATASLVSASVRKGRTATVKGQLTPKLRLSYVVERYVSGHWKSLGSTHAGSTGAYRYSFDPGARGTWTLRVRVPAQSNKTVGSLAGSTSKTLKLSVG